MLYLIFFITACCFLNAKEDVDPIYIKLETEIELSPICIGSIEEQKSGFGFDYLDKLDQVLRFDFNHNGYTYVTKNTQEEIQALRNLSFEAQKTVPEWSGKQLYLLRTRIQNQTLDARLYIVDKQIIKTIDKIPLTGNLTHDRRQIHALADSIFKALFNQEGIASTKLLFTMKTFQKETKKWISEVFESDYDGGNLRQVTSNSGYAITPAFVPPKQGYQSGSFVFVSYKIGQPKIYFGNLKDGTSQRFSLLKGNQLTPTISKQKDKIAFISDVTGNPDLFIQDFDPEKGAIGKPRQIFSAPHATQGTPTFSPDGKKIAFVSNKDGAPRIYIMDIPEAGVSIKSLKPKLITQGKESTAPAWSFDGSKIAYCCMTKGTRQIWVYDLKKGVELQITKGPGNKENPTWAPNNLHIAYNSFENNGSELYIVDLNEKKPIKLPIGIGEKHFPAWEIRL